MSSHFAQLIHLDAFGNCSSCGSKGITAHHVDRRGDIEKIRPDSKTLDHVPRDDSRDEKGDQGGVAEFQVGYKRDENTLADEVDDLANASVVAVLHHAPTIPGPHIVEPDDVFAKEGKKYGEHDNGVVDKIESFVVRSLLEAGVKTVLDVVQAEGISSLMGPFLFLSFNPPRVPL